MKSPDIKYEDDKSIRILLLSNMYPSKKSPSYGIFVENIYMQFKEADIDIKKCVIEGQSQTMLGKVLNYAAFILKAIFQLVFTKRMIYIHFVAHTSFPVLLLSYFRRFHIVAHVHGGDVMTQPQVGKRWAMIKTMMARRVLRLSTKIIVPSQYFSEFIQCEFNIGAQSIFISPSGGVDTQLFQSIEKQSKAYLSLGYIGRLDPGKGVDTLLKAVNILVTQGKEVSLTVVGSGKERDTLHLFVAENHLNSVCTFTEAKSHTELVAYYQAFDYFIFPSELNESLGLVGLEAMACGTPIITTGLAGIGDYFEDQRNGYQFESGDFDELSRLLSSLPSIESNEYRDMVGECLDTALRFDSELVKQKLINEFANIELNQG